MCDAPSSKITVSKVYARIVAVRMPGPELPQENPRGVKGKQALFVDFQGNKLSDGIWLLGSPHDLQTMRATRPKAHHSKIDQVATTAGPSLVH